MKRTSSDIPRNILPKLKRVKSSVKQKIISTCQEAYETTFKWREFQETVSQMKKYKKGKKLGFGAFGSVYVCLKKETEIVTLKEVICENTEAVNMCVKECLNAIKLDHPNILKHSDFFNSVDEEEGIFKVFLETEYYPLGDMYNFIKQNDVDELLIIEFMIQILQGLDYIHQKELIHRDLKPQNVLLKLNEKKDDFIISICDFGSSKSAKSMKKGSTVGTEHYVAPEVMEGQDCNYKIDIFSFGALCYYMLFKKERSFFIELLRSPETFKESIKEEFKRVQYENRELFQYIILKCLSKDPNNRPSPKEIISMLKYE